MRDDGSATSWVDHFLCSEQLVPSFSSFSLGGSGSNLSDHQPLVAVFNRSFNLTPNSASVFSSSASASSFSASQSKPSIAWHHASPVQITAYCDLVAHSLLASPTEVLCCTNPDCTSHLRVLESYCDSLCNILKVSAELTLPLSRQGRVIPGWNKAASVLKSKANFWHRVWREAGYTCSGVLFDIKRHSRSRFKYEVRRLCNVFFRSKLRDFNALGACFQDLFSLYLHLSSPTLISPTHFILPTNVYHFAYIWV